ncbi:MAG: hypothetical protein M1114_01925 [Candidatus Dependentiae bacterium]|nr:hypothetical protein [Candidatus Dependentiae bacterium]
MKKFNDKIDLNSKIEELAKEWFYLIDRKNSNKIIQSIVDLCDPYLQEYPRDTDIWIKLALAVYTKSYADDIRAMECMNEILSYDPTNPYALIILAYIESHWSRISDTTFEKLSLVQDEDNEIMSTIEYVKSWYYSEQGNKTLYQKSLENSVALCQQHVNNYIDLGWVYINQGKIEEGEKLKAIGLANVKIRYVYSNNTIYFNFTDVDEFLNERIKGTSTITWRA